MVTPFLGKVAAVVAPIANSAVVSDFPATVNAFAFAGTTGAGGADAEGAGEGESVGVGVGDGEGEGETVGDALSDGVGEGVADAFGEGVDLATGFAGAFFTGAFFTGFFLLFFATGFFAAKALSPIKKADATPATMARNFRRPELPVFDDGVSIVNRLVPFDCSARRSGCIVGSLLLHHKPHRAKSIHYRQIRRSYRNLSWEIDIFHTHR